MLRAFDRADVHTCETHFLARLDSMPQPQRNSIGLAVAFIGVFGITALVAGIAVSVQYWGASDSPVAASLAELEAGEELPNVHVLLGKHVALYDSSVIAIKMKAGQTTPPRGAKMSWFIYPVVSTENPLADGLGESRVDSRVRVLVRSSRYFSKGEIPNENRVESSVAGVAITNFTRLSSDVQGMLKRQLPDLDFSNVIVISDKLKPLPGTIKYGLIVAGLLLLTLAYFAHKQKRSPAEQQPPPEN